MTLLDIIISIGSFIIGFSYINKLKFFSKKEKGLLFKLYLYHVLITVAFHFYLLSNGGDALKYWNVSKKLSFSELTLLFENGFGSEFMYILNYIPSGVLDLDFFTGNILYGLLGFIGFTYFFKILKTLFDDIYILKKIKIFSVSIFPLFWFLPNLHFWSAGIGKDTILFFCIALFLYSMLNIRRRLFGLMISVIFSLLIRPHITLFLFLGMGMGYALDKSVKSYQKIIFFLFFAVGIISMFGYVTNFIQLESLDSSSIDQYTSQRASNLNDSDTSSGLDVSQYSFPMKVFTYLYRPLFYDTSGGLSIISSFENLLLLLFTLKIIRNKPFKGFKKSSFLIKGMLIFFILGTLAFSQILGNLGIMLRQKNMFIPVFFIFGYYLIAYNYNKKRKIIL